MATKKPPRQRQGDPAAGKVRDGLPTVPEMLRAMRLLQIPLAPEKVRALPLERQRTFLLALLGSCTEAYLYTQRAEDERETEEFHAVVATSDEIVAQADRRILLNLVQQRVERAHAAAHEAAQELDLFSVGAPLTGLLRAAGAVNEAWTSPYRGGIGDLHPHRAAPAAEPLAPARRPGRRGGCDRAARRGARVRRREERRRRRRGERLGRLPRSTRGTHALRSARGRPG